MKVILPILFCSLFGLGFWSQETPAPFEGTLKFEVVLKGPSAAAMQANEPNDQLTMHLKDGDYIIQLAGGRYPKTFLFIADSNYEYSIDAANKKAFLYSSHTDLSRNKIKEPTPEAKPTGQQKEVNGVLCDEYKLLRGDLLFYYYVNDAYRIDRTHYPERPRTKASFLAKGLKGRIPLMTIRKQRDQQLMVMTKLVKENRQTFDAALFDIPTGFQIKKRDYRW